MNNEEGLYKYKYPRPAVTSDIIVLSKDRKEILLIQRKNEPYCGCWAFPGGFMEIDETLQQCAKRELKEETNIDADTFFEVGTFSAIDRDPRGRTITTAYLTIVDKNITSFCAGDDAQNAQWFPLKGLPSLAFDHKTILEKAIEKLNSTE